MHHLFTKLSNKNLLFKYTKRFYDNKVVEYFENPPNVGSLDKNSPNVGTCKIKSNSRLSFMWRFIKNASRIRRRRKN